ARADEFAPGVFALSRLLEALTLASMKRILISILLFAAAAIAADIDGTWKASTDGPNGPMEWTFVFKADGAKLTGETITHHGDRKFPIQDGKVEGDNLSFTVTVNMHGSDMQMNS